MTADKLQSLVRILSNGAWTRYWLDLDRTSKGQLIMGLQCRNESGMPMPIHDAKSHGMFDAGDFLYTIDRTNEDGSPYFSTL